MVGKAGRPRNAPAAARSAQSAVARILNIQKRVQPDPEGWTVHDYINHSRPSMAALVIDASLAVS
jgi:hypothetical protein